MKILYYDCFAGISGDMNLGALVDLGVDAGELVRNLKKLDVGGWELSFKKTLKNGISGTLANVYVKQSHHEEGSCEIHSHAEPHAEACRSVESGAAGHGHGHEHRSYADIKRIIISSSLPEKVKSSAIGIFDIIARAEAQVHGRNIDEVHFHEVGAVDSIIDIVGAAICMDMLGVDKIVSSSVELGSGTVKCAHGVLPVPAPATAIISKAFPSKIGGVRHEATTPTGAAIIAAFADSYDVPVSGKCLGTGIGIGHRECSELPNILRVLLYESPDKPNSAEMDSVKMFEVCANIDDMTPEHVSALCSRLFKAGSLDVWQESIAMKKNRLAVKVCALCKTEKLEEVRRVFFAHSTTLGVRQYPLARFSIARESIKKNTEFGEISLKKSCFDGVERIKAEFDDCAKISERTGNPVDIIAKRIENLSDNG